MNEKNQIQIANTFRFLLPVYWRSTWKLLWSCRFHEKQLNMFLWFYFLFSTVFSFWVKISEAWVQWSRFFMIHRNLYTKPKLVLEKVETFRSVMFARKSFNNRAKTLLCFSTLSLHSFSRTSAIRIHEAFYILCSFCSQKGAFWNCKKKTSLQLHSVALCCFLVIFLRGDRGVDKETSQFIGGMKRLEKIGKSLKKTGFFIKNRECLENPEIIYKFP